MSSSQYYMPVPRTRTDSAPLNTKLHSGGVGTRLEMLERAITTINRNDSRDLQSRSSSTSVLPPEAHSNTPVPTAHRTLPKQGVLVRDGTSTRYINELLFSRVLEKVSKPLTNSSDGATIMAGFDGLISNPQLSVNIQSLFPSRGNATFLWQSYLNNVDVLLKVLHIPTTQPIIFAAINNTKHVAPDQIALLFSIYYAAVTSLRTEAVQLIFKEDRQSVLERFQRGLELCHRNQNGGRSGWTLNGIVLRTAQCIGLHRDGKQFHLPQLECEIRRRLWCQIIGYDARASEDHALSTNEFGGFSDTKLPLNADDRDLTPKMEKAPVLEPGWTEMTLFLVAAEMNQAAQQVFQLSIAVLNGNDKMASLEQLLGNITAHIKEYYLQYCDSNIPIQKAALLLGQTQIGHIDLLVRQQYLRGLSTEELAARATERTLFIGMRHYLYRQRAENG
ncbi:hypothetical protein N7495_007567 [Penicillium taxi]|uniref:uncharacterized protein n=1 Tax=Penicillium taxi TaxID=168475 RepID=UPI0025459CD8|nr:uncharacterized protein N7495_007567 [Penicillium taxi]KAJ5887526.1 hypothetical protein N7495_007567 [Penicillium taxi]